MMYCISVVGAGLAPARHAAGQHLRIYSKKGNRKGLLLRRIKDPLKKEAVPEWNSLLIYYLIFIPLTPQGRGMKIFN